MDVQFGRNGEQSAIALQSPSFCTYAAMAISGEKKRCDHLISPTEAIQPLAGSDGEPVLGGFRYRDG